jgi:hypothetical protein
LFIVYNLIDPCHGEFLYKVEQFQGHHGPLVSFYSGFAHPILCIIKYMHKDEKDKEQITFLNILIDSTIVCFFHIRWQKDVNTTIQHEDLTHNCAHRALTRAMMQKR